MLKNLIVLIFLCFASNISFAGSCPILIQKIEEHVKETNSKYAQNILDNWDNEKLLFWQIVPKEMINKFDQPVLIKEEKSA